MNWKTWISTRSNTVRKRTIYITAILTAGLLLCSGCLWAPGLERLKDEMTAQMPGAQFDKEVALTLGPMSLALARIALQFVPEPEVRQSRQYLSDIRRVELAVYETEALPSLRKVAFPKQLNKLLHEDWEIAAKVIEEDQLVWVLYHESGERIDYLCAVVLDDENLVLVKVKGNLGRLFLKGLREAKVFKDKEHT
jgi:hypothetical protein